MSRIAGIPIARMVGCSLRGAAAAALLLVLNPAGAQQINPVWAQEGGLQPGEAFVTRFSGAVSTPGPTGKPTFSLDPKGVVGSIIDIRAPRQPPLGQHWIDEPQRNPIRAEAVGQVFGVALDDATPPNVYVSATAAFGLHLAAGSQQWMPGMWGVGGGPNTIYRLEAANSYRPTVFARVALAGRQNTGPALGNLAFDRKNKQIFVSDLETGMIHRIRAADGADLGHYDHGAEGRTRFLDATSGQTKTLTPISFDPNSRARLADCPSGDFEHSPECWNLAASGRRIWGLAVRQNPDSGEVRLYYAVWSSPAFGNTEWGGLPEDEKRNSIWSVRLGSDGSFDISDVRREFLVPDFYLDPEDIARGGYSQPVSDIAFAECGQRRVMLLAERGGIRNQGLGIENAFAYPNEARALRYELDAGGNWQPVGRYDVGFYDRSNKAWPHLRANCAGGVAFGYAYTADSWANSWAIDRTKPDETAWFSGDALCSPDGPCFSLGTGRRDDGSQVHGIQGTPSAAFDDILPAGSAETPTANTSPYPPTGPSQSYLIDTDINVGRDGRVDVNSLMRNDATRIGAIAIYQQCPAEAPPPAIPGTLSPTPPIPPIEQPPPTAPTTQPTPPVELPPTT
ncbi:MAG: hypothetical protein JOZ40_17350, partial [Methylobacteriaceae bacterium]|nr:hypothetical protein [Methylobacteriaceae bacterium]